MKGDSMLECGHPEGCITEEYGERKCRWCAEVEGLRGQIEALTDCIGKRAVVNYDGTLTVCTPEPIGLLMVHGGTVNVGTGSTVDVTAIAG